MKLKQWEVRQVYKINVTSGVFGEQDKIITTRIANAIFYLSAFARFPALHCFKSMIHGATYLVMDSMIELNDYYQYH